VSRWHTMWDDGETVCRRTTLAGRTWHVLTDPGQSRWIDADGAGSVIRGHTGWNAYTYSPYQRVAHRATFRQAIDALNRQAPA
jgi:hypothetical protein